MEEMFLTLLISFIFHCLWIGLSFTDIKYIDELIEYSNYKKTRIERPKWFKLYIPQMARSKGILRHDDWMFLSEEQRYKIKLETMNQINKATFVFSFITWGVALLISVLMVALCFVHSLIPVWLCLISLAYSLVLTAVCLPYYAIKRKLSKK